MPLQQIQSNMVGTGSVSTSKLAISGVVFSTGGTLSANNIYITQTNVTTLCSIGIRSNRVSLFNNTPIVNLNSTWGMYIDSYTRELKTIGGSYSFTYNGMDMRPVSHISKTTYSGSAGTDQTFVVPAGVNYIFVKMWGAGGGAGRAGGWSYGAHGGGGGHSRGIIPVFPGETLTIVAGRGGLTVNSTPQYGGGGYQPNQAADGDKYSGMGGGYAGIFRGAASPTTCLMAAGGGGGGGSSTSWTGNDGGAGGGRIGCQGEAPFSSQISWAGYGGYMDSPEFPLAQKYAPQPGYSPSFASTSQGGAFVGGNSWNISYGGGGGAGYMGGGGGGQDTTPTMGGGGGGTGFISSTVIHGSMYTGTKRYPAFFWDPDLSVATRSGSTPQPHAYGGINTQNNQPASAWSGGHGWVVIYY